MYTSRLELLQCLRAAKDFSNVHVDSKKQECHKVQFPMEECWGGPEFPHLTNSRFTSDARSLV